MQRVDPWPHRAISGEASERFPCPKPRGYDGEATDEVPRDDPQQARQVEASPTPAEATDAVDDQRRHVAVGHPPGEVGVHDFLSQEDLSSAGGVDGTAAGADTQLDAADVD